MPTKQTKRREAPNKTNTQQYSNMKATRKPCKVKRRGEKQEKSHVREYLKKKPKQNRLRFVALKMRERKKMTKRERNYILF